MPAYYMKHPQHGAHVVYSADEVKFHEARGWKMQEEEVKPVAQAVIESAKRKPGRPRKER